MAGHIKFGRFSLFCIGLAIMLTGAVYWLEFLAPEVLWDAALWFFILPLIAITFLAFIGGIGVSNEPIFGKVGAAALFLLFLLYLDAVLLETTVPQSILDAPVLGLVGMAAIFVSVLFAIYEETFFTAIAGLFKRAMAPDWFVIVISAVVFWLLHALRYPDTTFYALFLSISRAMLTGALLKVDNTDVSYLAHVSFNILTVVF